MGESIVFIQSNELWSKKRKKLSHAFYKEKIVKMLNIIIHRTSDKVEVWKQKYADKYLPYSEKMNIIKEIADHVMECIEACVFG